MRDFEQLQHENITLAQHIYAAFERRDIASLLTVLANDIDWLFFGPADIPFAGHYQGHDHVAHFFATALETAEFIEFEPREFLAGANSVLVQGYEKVRAKATGKVWETEWAHVFTISNGKIVKMREYYDTAVVAAAFQTD